jgi:hypothetical protein
MLIKHKVKCPQRHLLKHSTSSSRGVKDEDEKSKDEKKKGDVKKMGYSAAKEETVAIRMRQGCEKRRGIRG